MGLERVVGLWWGVGRTGGGWWVCRVVWGFVCLGVGVG